jgi:crossover junction endodeoxyribonuclease RusA
MALARAKAAQRLEWATLARHQGAAAVAADSLHIRLTGQAPDRRARDVDGLLSSCKAGLDGLAGVLEVDDSRWTFTLPPLELDPAKVGAVVLEISQMGAA